MKYIAYIENDIECIITFPGGRGQLNHKQIADRLCIDRDTILGAGFFMEIGGRKFFTGESSKLDIISRGEKDRELYEEQCRRTL